MKIFKWAERFIKWSILPDDLDFWIVALIFIFAGLFFGAQIALGIWILFS